MGHMPAPSVPVSWGELLDKITILEIKRARIAAPAARANVDKEHRLLSMIGAQAIGAGSVDVLLARLRQVNEELWGIEDAIRKEEAAGRFGPAFISLARSVYQMNDRRAAIKREINRLLGSELVEEKSYAAFADCDRPADRMRAGERGSGRRFGILTFHRCINYGSYWQARCLVGGLRSMGADAVLLDHESSRVTRAELRCALRPTLPQPTPRSDFPAYAEKTRKFLKAFGRLPLSRPFPIDRPEEMEDCDAIIVGSDEVWNLRHPWYGGCSTFYGAGVRAPLISYAASFGNQDASEGLSDYWAGQLGNFSAMSVRDENSRIIVRSALGRDPELVLDPCLLFPPHAAAGGKGGYVALYGHNFPDWFALAIRRWADARRRPVVSIGYRNDWADEQRLTAGPEEFAEWMARADGVVTNFFHGCVFALINDRPFVTAPSAYRFNKVRDLMQALGTQRHMVTPDADDRVYAELLDEPPDGRVQKRIAALRRQSSDYLRRSLEMAS